MSESPDLYSEFLDFEYAHGYMGEHLNSFIATQIKVLREQRGWNQTELGERAGMKQERISVLENVNHSSWSIATLRRIAEAFDLRLSVSFETFSNGIDDLKKFSRSSLERESREKDLAANKPHPRPSGDNKVSDLLSRIADAEQKKKEQAKAKAIGEQQREYAERGQNNGADGALASGMKPNPSAYPKEPRAALGA